MSRVDFVLLHAPSVYDFRERSIMFGPVSDMVPSTPIFEMYPLGFTTMAEYMERHGTNGPHRSIWPCSCSRSLGSTLRPRSAT